MTASRLVRLHSPVLVLAAAPLLLGLRFGGYHMRHAGWLVLVLGGWACAQAARGRLSSPRSPGGLAAIAFVALVGWTTASIAWADVSRHDAWVEGVRALGYAAMFVLGGALLANARSYVRYARLVGLGIGLLAAATIARLVQGDAPLTAFVAGRLDAPIGYAPALAAVHLMGALLLLGIGCAAQQRWQVERRSAHLVASGAALAGAGLCLGLALLAQSRGTVPALLVAIVVALVATPDRFAWLMRAGLLGVAMFAARGPLGAVFSSQFDLRQAPFTEGSNEPALLEAAVEAARAAGSSLLLVAIVLALLGAAIVPLAAWCSERLGAWQERHEVRLALPITSLVLAAVIALVVVAPGDGTTPAAWANEQWRGCVDPPERVNDPGSSSSYFANTGTGRCDYYRVALRSGRDNPLLGIGAGNFRGAYVRERTTGEEPRFAHSLPLQLLGELGLVGALLGATLLGCVMWAAARFVRSGPGRDPTFAGAIALLAYWTAHASIDWLWQLPAVSLPAMAFAGGLVACVSPATGKLRAQVAAPIAAGAMLATAALVLLITIADTRLRTARDPQLQRSDARAALTAAREAQDADPTWAEPLITEASLLAKAGQRSQAAEAARRAVELEPRAWSVQYRASGLIGLDDTAGGQAAFLAARRLNPRLPATADRDEPVPGRPTNPDSPQNPDA